MKVIYLARALLLDWLRSKTGVFFTILFPVMMMSIMSAVFNTSRVSDLYIQNLDVYYDDSSNYKPTQLSAAFIDALRASNAFNIKQIDPSIDALGYALRLADEGKSVRLLIIPRGFDEHVREGIFYTRINLMISTFDTFLNDYRSYIPDNAKQGIERGKEEFRKILESKNDNNSDDIDKGILLILDKGDRGYEQIKGIIYNVMSNFQQKALGIQDIITLEVKDARGYNLADYYLASVLAAWVMVNGLVGVSSIVTDFKRRGLLKRFMSTPLTRLEWIASNMLTQTMLAVILAMIMIIVAYFAFHASIPSVASIIILIIGAFCFTGLGMLIAGALKDVEAVSGASNALAFPMMFLSGAFWPLEMMPDYMQSIAKFLPLTYFIQALKVSMVAYAPSIVLYNSLMLIILTVVFVALGSCLTRWKQS